jgi:tetratricopeptide (TPR) repeat protein
MKFAAVILAGFLLVAGAGCGPSKSSISPAQRKEATRIYQEGQFALTLRDAKRAEGLFEKAAGLCPDIGDYWMALGTTRMRLGKRSEAKAAYQKALAAFKDEAAEAKADSGPALQQVVMLALLGRADEARVLVKKLPGRFPNDIAVTAFVTGKQLEAMLADPKFKELAL